MAEEEWGTDGWSVVMTIEVPSCTVVLSVQSKEPLSKIVRSQRVVDWSCRSLRSLVMGGSSECGPRAGPERWLTFALKKELRVTTERETPRALAN